MQMSVHAHTREGNTPSSPPPSINSILPPEYNSPFTLKSAALRGLRGMASESAVSAAAHAVLAGALASALSSEAPKNAGSQRAAVSLGWRVPRWRWRWPTRPGTLPRGTRPASGGKEV